MSSMARVGDRHRDERGVGHDHRRQLPVALVLSPAGTHGYVSNQIDGTVSVIDISTGAVSATIPVGNSPIGVSITPDGRHIYVANFGDGTVSMINTETNAVSAIIAAGRGPIDSAICPS